MSEVWLNTHRGRVPLTAGGLLAELDDARATIFVTGGDTNRPPRLDGRTLLRLQDQPPSFAAEVSLGGDVGYHEVLVYNAGSIVPGTYAFCTRKGTRRALLVREMTDMVERVGWTTSTLFFEGALGAKKHRVPGVILGWMIERVPLILEEVRKILVRPSAEVIIHRSRQPFARRLDLNGTFSILRQNPKLLTERAEGVIAVRQKRYSPEQIIDQSARDTVDTCEHRQIRQFLQWMHAELLSMSRDKRLGFYRELAEQWMGDITKALRHPIWRSVSRAVSVERVNTRPTALQRRDERYGILSSTFLEYRSLRSYEPADEAMRTFLEEGHKIFEAFCALVVAQAWGLTPCGESLRDRIDGASFTGNGIRLFYDVKPPAAVMASWREKTVCPDRDRPDILLANRNNLVALLDVKFKSYADEGDLTHDIQEMQAYQHSYGIKSSAILTPYGQRLDIKADGYLIRVIPIRPVAPDDLPQLLASVREATEDLFCQTRA